MKKLVVLVAALFVAAVVGPVFAQGTPAPAVKEKGTEGPDVRAKVQEKGTEGPDVRKAKKKTASSAAPKVKEKGTEGPDVRKVEPKGTEGPDVKKK